jgi:hypothetical protein
VRTNQEAPGPATEGNSQSNFEDLNLGYQHTGQQRHEDSNCIYGRGVWLYIAAGWRAALPLPPAAKSPPPKGFTGYDGAWPTDEQIATWTKDQPADANLMLRVNYGVIGIDVDAYGNKMGGRTLEEAEKRWGPLPPTYRSSSRGEDVVSGIRVYQVPEGVLFRTGIKFDDLGVGHIDIIQPHHRHITVYPSIHPNGGRYRWYGPDGVLLPEGVVPHVRDLPELPPKWVEQLSRDAVREEVFDGSASNRTRTARERINEELYHKLIALDDGRSPEPMVAQRGDKALNEVMNGPGSRYENARDHVASLIRFQAIGRVGVPAVLSDLRRAYVMEVTDTRPQHVAESEFLRLIEGAAAIVAATMPSDDWHTTARDSDGDGEDSTDQEESRDTPTWSPVDLTDLLAGESEQLRPTLFERTDGHGLVYPGMTHSFHGESESGKSLIIQAETVRLVNDGQDVLYIDFDSDVASVIARLREFGADPQAIADHFRYVQPEVRPDCVEERCAWEKTLSRSYALVVIDGVTDALGIFGYSMKDNDDVSQWIRTVPKQIATRTGAAVVLIDHVTKDSTNRGRWAIGGQAKMAGLTGAAYTVEVTAPLGRGLRGEVVLRVGKDRPGAVRPRCGSFRKDRTQEAARIIVDSTVSPPEVIVGAPGASGDADSSEQTAFRPTNLMQRASEVIEQHPGELTKNKVAEKAGGKKQTTLLAVDILYQEGYLTSERGRSGHFVYTSVKPYREQDDPMSDRYVNFGNAFDKA